MYDFLKDIVTHTNALGFVELVKITGDDKDTTLDAMASDRSVVVAAKFHTPIKDFKGTFGMPNLSKLSVILGIPEYKEKASIKVVTQKRNEEMVPVSIHFENEAKDFKNDYRFMSAEVVASQLSTVKFRGAKWNLTIVPSVSAIQRFKYQAQANSEETTFVAKTDGTDLKFYFGDHSTHAGNFVFQPNVTGQLTKEWAWPVTQVLAILGLDGNKVMKFSDEGAAMITVDSGLAEYNYILPAQQK
jgi:hypothetical protein